MFIGHHAVAFAAKKIAPNTSLGTLVAAAQFLDLLWPPLLLTGIEHARIEPGITAVSPLDLYDYPLSHSLAGALLWSILFGGLYSVFKKYHKRTSLSGSALTIGAIVLGLTVFSHWVLDFITHRPDMLLWFSGTTYVGLGLWNSWAGTILVEGGLFAIGGLLYMRSTKSNDRVGTYGWWGYVVFLLTMYVASLLGPPPPDTGVLAVGGNAGWLFVLWAWWFDTHRTAVQAEPIPASRV